MSFGKFVIILAAGMILTLPVVGSAKSNLSITPMKDSSVLFDGQENAQFKSETPLSENQVVRCKGDCLVQADGFQLMGHDGSAFSVSQSEKGWDLNIKSGSVDFATKPGAKPFAFRNGKSSALVEEVRFPTDGSLLKGNVSVTNKGLRVSMVNGELSLRADNKVQPVHSGESVLLADGRMNLLPAGAIAAAGAGAAGAAAGIAGAGSAVPLAAGAVAVGGVATAGLLSGTTPPTNDPITPMTKPVSPY